jgi:hypothetical protein
MYLHRNRAKSFLSAKRISLLKNHYERTVFEIQDEPPLETHRGTRLWYQHSGAVGTARQGSPKSMGYDTVDGQRHCLLGLIGRPKTGVCLVSHCPEHPKNLAMPAKVRRECWPVVKGSKAPISRWLKQRFPLVLS